MALHDWSDRPGWEGMHHLWITELLRWVKPRLPVGYRAYIGSAPLLAVGAPVDRPDVSVHSWSPAEAMVLAGASIVQSGTDSVEPDEEIAVATLDPETAVYVERQGRLIAAVELISPRNKDRPIARECLPRTLPRLSARRCAPCADRRTPSAGGVLVRGPNRRGTPPEAAGRSSADGRQLPRRRARGRRRASPGNLAATDDRGRRLAADSTPLDVQSGGHPRPRSDLRQGRRGCLSELKGGRQGIRTLIPRGETALAVRPGQPYPATFQDSERQVDRRGVEPRFPGCRPGVVPLDQQPVRSSPAKVRPRIELGPPPYKGGMPPAHSRTTASLLSWTSRPGGSRTPVSSL